MFDTLFYGVDSFGSIRHINEVESGIACDCTCPSCGGRLIAKKGTKMIHHFAHAVGESCEYGYETTLHMMAKDAFLKHKRVYLPAIPLIKGHTINASAYGRFYDILNVQLEKRLGGVVPDIILTTDIGEVIIEIYVTHKCDFEKRIKLKSLGIPALEVDLSKEGYVREHEIWGKINKHIYWIYADAEKGINDKEHIEILLKDFESKEIIRDMYAKVDCCERGGGVESTLSRCKRCVFCGGISEKYVYCGFKNKIIDKESLYFSPDKRDGYKILKIDGVNKCWYCGGSGTLEYINSSVRCVRCGKKTWLETYDGKF